MYKYAYYATVVTGRYSLRMIPPIGFCSVGIREAGLRRGPSTYFVVASGGGLRDMDVTSLAIAWAMTKKSPDDNVRYRIVFVFRDSSLLIFPFTNTHQ